MLKDIFNYANYFFNPYALPSLIVGVYCLFLGIFVWAKNKKLLGFSLFTLTFPCGMWLLAVVLVLLSRAGDVATFWVKNCYFWVPFISVGSYFFCLCMTKYIAIKSHKILLIIGYIVMIPFALTSLFTDLMVKAPPLKYFWGFEGHAGPLLLPFLNIWSIWALLATYTSYVAQKKATSGLDKAKLRLLFYAYLLGYPSTVDYFGDFGIGIYPFGFIFIFVYISLLAYNMIRYRAFEIETVIHRTALWLLTSSYIFVPIVLFLYFTRPFLSRTPILPLGIIITLLFFVFEYYRNIIQPRVDHLFRRRKYDYQTVLGKVAEKIATTISIEDLTQQFLTEVCEAMYLRNAILYVLAKDETKYSLLGRRGYKEINGLRQRTTLEIYDEEQRRQIAECQREISCSNLLARWFTAHQDILEKEQVEVNPQYESIKQEALACFKEHDIEVVVPLVVQGKVNALLGLGKKENLRAYTIKDIELLKKLGQEAGVTVFNALHYEQLVETERLEEEMDMGRKIQMALLPHEAPEIPRLNVQGLMQPAKEIGGDYYDFVTLPDKEKLAIVIGDVSGKGVAAGLLMSMVKATIQSLSQEGLAPKRLLMRINQMLYQNIRAQKFMTLLYFIWQSNNQTFTYSSAGHEHILIYRNRPQTIEVIQSGGFMLGMLPDIDSFLEEKQIKLEPRDKILLYTDGVTEAENESGDRFGLERLKAAFQRHSSKPAQELMHAVKDEVYSFIGSYPQYDDITLVVLEAQ